MTRMEKTIHLFEENVYLLSNHSVALNPMFRNKDMQDYFLNKMEFYLSPVSNVLAYHLSDNSFELLVKLKDRATFEEHYRNKNTKKFMEDREIPETTYIISQAMANLQVSLAKHFNFVEKRSGTLMAARFARKLIESEEEMMKWKDRLNRGEKRSWFGKNWQNVKHCDVKSRTSRWMYVSDLQSDTTASRMFLRADFHDLVVNWNKPKIYRLNSTNSFHKLRLNQLFHEKGRAKF